MVPLIGVMLWGWDVFSLMLLYWAENLVIGALTITLMIVLGLRKGLATFIGALFMGAFFTVHYGMFCMGHGVFIFSIFYPADAAGIDPGGFFAPLHFIAAGHVFDGFWWALAGVAVVQLVQVFHGGLGYDRKNPAKMMMTPYARIVILHITIIFGGMATMALGQPIAALIVLIGLKTAFDLGFWFWGEKKKDNRDNNEQTGRNADVNPAL